MAELVDAHVSGACVLTDVGGSTPPFGTLIIKGLQIKFCSSFSFVLLLACHLHVFFELK